MFIILLCVVLWRMFESQRQDGGREQPIYSDFMAQVDRNNIRQITIYPSPNCYDVEGEWREPARKFRLTIIRETASDLIKELREKGVSINIQEETSADWVNFVLTTATLVLLDGF